MRIAQIEDRILDMLKVQMKDLGVIEAAPVDASTYEAKAAGGCVLVRFNGTRYEDPPPTPAPPPRGLRLISFVILCGSRSLRAVNAHRGAYEILEDARDAVAYRPIDPGGGLSSFWFYPSSEDFGLEKGGVWWYVLTITARTAFQTAPFRQP